MRTQAATLIIASSEADSNLYYLTRFIAPDPFIFVQILEEKIIMMSDLEIDRARKQASVDTILSYNIYEEKAVENGIKDPNTIDVLHQFLRERGISHLKIPADFGIKYALLLEEQGYHIDVKNDPFIDERLAKKDEEISFIKDTLRHSEMAIAKAIEFIRNTEIVDGYLYSKGRKVSSEDIKKLISVYLLKNGFLALHTIVSCGEDTAFPHEEGTGPIRANSPIILDLFPRSIGNRYYADITRTIVKGKATKEIKDMYRTVLSAQKKAISSIRAGVNGQDIHEIVIQYFISQGYESGEVGGRMQGFFHGTGHGVGLDIHEAPRISKKSDVLSAGNVVTVEPGLYYKDIGGVRLEDMVVIRKDGAINLTSCPKLLEI